jgi:hypothetical protein
MYNKRFTFEINSFIQDVLHKEYDEIIESETYNYICSVLDKNYDIRVYFPFKQLITDKMLKYLLYNKLLPSNTFFTGEYLIFVNMNTMFSSLLEMYQSLSKSKEISTIGNKKYLEMKEFMRKMKIMINKDSDELSKMVENLKLKNSPIDDMSYSIEKMNL